MINRGNQAICFVYRESLHYLRGHKKGGGMEEGGGGMEERGRDGGEGGGTKLVYVVNKPPLFVQSYFIILVHRDHFCSRNSVR